jgi:hypothetical protein
MVKSCSKCLVSFDCCNEKPGCWCEELYLDIETLKQLKGTFDNCLCPKCLKEYAQKESGN